MIKVLDVAYARFQAPDLDLMEQFLGDFGLTTSEKTENALYMRCSDENHHTHVTELGDAKFVGFAFNAASLEDLNTIAKVEGASKIEEMDEPGGGYRVRINDPDNFQIEVVYGMQTLPNLSKQNISAFRLNICLCDSVNINPGSLRYFLTEAAPKRGIPGTLSDLSPVNVLYIK